LGRDSLSAVKPRRSLNQTTALMVYPMPRWIAPDRTCSPVR